MVGNLSPSARTHAVCMISLRTSKAIGFASAQSSRVSWPSLGLGMMLPPAFCCCSSTGRDSAAQFCCSSLACLTYSFTIAHAFWTTGLCRHAFQSSLSALASSSSATSRSLPRVSRRVFSRVRWCVGWCCFSAMVVSSSMSASACSSSFLMDSTHSRSAPTAGTLDASSVFSLMSFHMTDSEAARTPSFRVFSHAWASIFRTAWSSRSCRAASWIIPLAFRSFAASFSCFGDSDVRRTSWMAWITLSRWNATSSGTRFFCAQRWITSNVAS
mmetsp:Transcript_5672/g.35263  ORF Transcript_5672/g.35263 Transcript_5672/m.35263 type:complete len:271 (-) Transcript_5672:397-1209(-)